MRITKITLVRKKVTENRTINDLLLRFGESLGLFSSRDKDKSCYRIFILLIKALKADLDFTSDEIAVQTGLTRGTVVHHLNRLMEAGIVTSERTKYFLNVKNLEDLVEQMRTSINTVFDDLSILAQDIDQILNLK